MAGASGTWDAPRKKKKPEAAIRKPTFKEAMRKKRKEMQQQYNVYRRPATIRPEDK